MRIILDTNVLISGIFFTGPPSKILQAWKDRKLQLVITTDIFSAYVRVSELISKKYPSIDITEVLNLIAVHSELIHSFPLPERVCEDPEDDKFLI